MMIIRAIYRKSIRLGNDDDKYDGPWTHYLSLKYGSGSVSVSSPGLFLHMAISPGRE